VQKVSWAPHQRLRMRTPSWIHQPSSHRLTSCQSFNHAFVFAKFSLLCCGCVSYNDCIYHLFCASTKLYAWAWPGRWGKGRAAYGRPDFEPDRKSRPRAQPIFKWARSIWPSALILGMAHRRVLQEDSGVFSVRRKTFISKSFLNRVSSPRSYEIIFILMTW